MFSTEQRDGELMHRLTWQTEVDHSVKQISFSCHTVQHLVQELCREKQRMSEVSTLHLHPYSTYRCQAASVHAALGKQRVQPQPMKSQLAAAAGQGSVSGDGSGTALPALRHRKSTKSTVLLCVTEHHHRWTFLHCRNQLQRHLINHH